MTRFSSGLSRLVAAGVLLVLSGCSDLLEVRNPNNPDQNRVLAQPSDVEALIRGSYVQALDPLLSSNGINMQLGSVAFENSAMAANFGMIERSAIFPRAAIINTTSNQFAGNYYEVWAESYAAIRSASDGLARLADADFTLGSATSDARAEAFGKFVLFFAHANLAITYDQASIYDETVAASEIVPLTDYKSVMNAAMGYADAAIAVAAANPTISFPEDWLGVAMDATRFVQVVRSLKARYRMQNARSAADLTAADYSAVISDVNAGITTDYAVVDNDDKWDFWMQDYMSFRGAWHQVPYWIHGMADQSGAYQTWLTQPFMTRTPFTIVTPDLRFPQGATDVAQRAAPGKNIRRKTNNTGEAGWIRAERGQWRWSHYLDIRYQAYYNANNTGLAIPIIQVKEMQLLKAEALWKRNTGTDQADAVEIINTYRVADGGLSLADVAGTNTSCVPKLPSGACGDTWEMLKWEKRMIFFMTVYGGFYFDSRRWGDLPQYTYRHYPVPARELEVRQLPLYTFGGSADATSAGQSTYFAAWGF